MDLIQQLSEQLNISKPQIQSTLALLEQNNTVPFIARYRKEQTKGLDEEQIFAIKKQYDYGINLLQRKEDVSRLIDEQGLLTKDLQAQIQACERLSEVEEIYKPFKQKKLTKASIAISKGLEPLASWMLSKDDSISLNDKAKEFINQEVETIEQAIEGACDIISENLSNEPSFRRMLKTYVFKYGKLVSSLKKNADDPKQVYKMYYEFSLAFNKLQHHHILAINRAEKQKVVTIRVDFDINDFLLHQRHDAFNHPNKTIAALIRETFDAGVKKSAYPSIVRQIRGELTEQAHNHSIDLFAFNIESLLSTPPMKDKVVLALDPAFRTGCKLAVVNEIGQVVAIETVYPFEPQHNVKQAKEVLNKLMDDHHVDIVAIGNGTASRESEQLVSEILQERNDSITYAIISEAGASVYSASALAKKEFPKLDVSLRSAISIGRRLQDPLSELIKIDPQSIGVGQYQHDLPTTSLKEKIDFVVDKVVNRVGVNINTASDVLLAHVSGLNKTAIKSIVETRNKRGLFTSRYQLQELKGFGDKMFEQAAGFLRILDGDVWLDQTAIHPESYDVVDQILNVLEIKDITDEKEQEKLHNINVSALAKQCNIDEFTLSDIIENLLSPNRDYRTQFDGVLLKNDILNMDDLKIGLKLQGSVSNIVDFGVFVDIGLKNDGFIHRSQCNLPRNAHPMDRFSINQIVNVEIIDIEKERQRVSLKVSHH